MIDDATIKRVAEETIDKNPRGSFRQFCIEFSRAIEQLARQEQREEDTARLDWIADKLFQSNWNGVLDGGSRTHWTIWSGWRHVVALMEGKDFRAALDKAIRASGKENSNERP